MPYFLVCNPGLANETYYPLKPGKNTIGRARDNDIVLLHGSLSRHHAEVFAIYYPPGESSKTAAENNACITIRDRQSLNGTFINRTRVQNSEIQTGEIITLGKVNFKLIYAVNDAQTYTIPGSSAANISDRESDTQ